MKTFTHKQETWDEKQCAKRARYAPADARGNKPPKGIIARVASHRPEYGQTRRYNGGIVIGGEWYEAEHRPLPIIPDSYEFFTISSWGKAIRKKVVDKSLSKH